MGAAGDSPVCPAEFGGSPSIPAFQAESSEHPLKKVVQFQTIRPKTILCTVFIRLCGNFCDPELFIIEMTNFDILTLFPKLCESAFSESILKKAQENLLIQVRCLNIRDWATDKHRVTDEPPYGGGPGMIMKPEPIFSAVEAIRNEKSYVILMAPGGRRFNQEIAIELSGREHLIFVCGHYEGIDHRVAEHLVDDEISIGDYVLTNGAIAAAVVVDAVARLIPGVLGEEESAQDESFSNKLLECPQYTRPSDFRGWRVPEVLLSGNHAMIRSWREERARERTSKRRPDLL